MAETEPVLLGKPNHEPFIKGMRQSYTGFTAACGLLIAIKLKKFITE
jgi:hypothetical protein